jgi:hypothetical protein
MFASDYGALRASPDEDGLAGPVRQRFYSGYFAGLMRLPARPCERS